MPAQESKIPGEAGAEKFRKQGVEKGDRSAKILARTGKNGSMGPGQAMGLGP